MRGRIHLMALGILAVFPAAALAASSPHSGHDHKGMVPSKQPMVSQAVSGQVSTGLPFKNPSIITSQNGRLDVRLTASKEVVNISGKLVGARVYAAASKDRSYPYSFMPPVLSVAPGDNLQVTVLLIIH